MSCSYNQDDQNFRRLLLLEAKLEKIREVVNNVEWYQWDHDGMIVCAPYEDPEWVKASVIEQLMDIL